MNWKTKTLLGILGVGLVWGVSHVAADAQELPADRIQVQDQMLDPAVQIRIGTNLMNAEFEGLCSGEIVKSSRDAKTGKVTTNVLTAKHCTEDEGQRMQVVKYVHNKALRETKQDVYKAKVCARSYVSDLAMIKLDDEDTYFDKVAKVAPADIALDFGDMVNLVGYPAGLGLTWTEGRLGYVEDTTGLAFGDISKSSEFFRATPNFTGGSSGSSMFYKDTDGDYKIIGTLTGGGFQYIGFYTPVNEINTFLSWAYDSCKASD